jgi:hypothetical protein
MNWLSSIGTSIPRLISAGGKIVAIKIAFIGAIGVVVLTTGFYYSSHKGSVGQGKATSPAVASFDKGLGSPVGQQSLNLSSPQATVTSFTKAAATGNAGLARACFSPQGVDYDDIWEVLTAAPSSRVYPMRELLESVDADKPMPIISQEPKVNGLGVAWRVTFKKPFTIQEGGSEQTFQPGDTFVLDGSLVKEGENWLFYGM